MTGKLLIIALLLTTFFILLPEPPTGVDLPSKNPALVNKANAKSTKIGVGLITDFSREWRQTAIGYGLTETTDQVTGGKSEVKLTLLNEAGFDELTHLASRNKVLHVSGEIKSGFIFPWSGVSYALSNESQPSSDLSRLKFVSFRAKGSTETNNLYVLIFEKGSFKPVQQQLVLTREWQTFQVNLKAFNNVDLTEISNISLVKSQSLGKFEFMIDDLSFE